MNKMNRYYIPYKINFIIENLVEYWIMLLILTVVAAMFLLCDRFWTIIVTFLMLVHYVLWLWAPTRKLFYFEHFRPTKSIAQ